MNRAHPPDTNWERKLAACVVGGAAVLAAQDANASVIYSGPQDVAIGVDQSYGLDLDGDAIVDFTFENLFDPISNARVFEVHPDGTNAVTHFAGLAGPLSAGTLLPGTQKFTSSPAPLAGDPNVPLLWEGVSRQFLGLQFTIAGATHYGWVRLSVDGTADVTATVHDWAYNDQARGAIRTGAVPEPASLALLALGAAGVGAYRARRGRSGQSADSAERA